MKKIKLTVKSLAAVLSAALLLTGCASAGSTATTAGAAATDSAATAGAADAGADTTAASTTADNSEKITLTVAYWGIQDAFNAENADSDTIYQQLCQQLNIEISPIEVTWNDYSEKNKVWAASSTLPDVFVDALATDNFGLYKNWAEQGIIKELPTDLSAYANLDTLFSLDSVQALALDGKFYMIPRGGDLTQSVSEASGMSRAVMYRKDWAAEAGYDSAPETYDELVEMVKAMQANHPDAVGIAMNSTAYMGTLALDIFPELANPSSWVYENDQWMPSYVSEKTIPYLERLQSLYQEGLLDPDFITQKDGDGIGKFMSGKACVMLGGDFDPEVFMESNTDVTSFTDAFGFILPFAAEDGNAYVYTSTPYWSESYISAQVDDAKLDRILQLLDYMYSHEYATLLNNGIEGVDWEKTDDGNVSLLTDTTLGDKYPITASIGYLASWHTGYELSGDSVTSSNEVIASYNTLKNETAKYESENAVAAPINFDVFLMNNDAKTNISSLWQDYQAYANNIIIGDEDPATAHANMISEFNSKGLQEAIASVTSQASSEGIQP